MKTNLATYFKITLLCIPFLFTNCSKDDEGISAEEKEKMLTSNTWKISEVDLHTLIEYTILGQKVSDDSTSNVLEGLAECEYDIDLNFLNSGILQHTASDLYCGEDLQGSLTWDLSPSGNDLTIISDEGALFFMNSTGLIAKEEVVLKVLVLNENTLKCKFTLPIEEVMAMYSAEFGLEFIEELGIEISGYMEVDYTFVAK